MNHPLDLRRVNYFSVLAEELHFGRAAERLHIAQPALSEQIRKLEDSLSVRLLDRTTRSVKLSRAGEVFLTKARFGLTQLEEAVEMAQLATTGASIKLAIGFHPAVNPILPEMLGRYHARYPNALFDLHFWNSLEQIPALREGKLHIGFLRPPMNCAPLAIEHIAAEGFVAALPKNSPLARRAQLKLQDLADQPFISFPGHHGFGLQEHILSFCRRAGFEPRIVQQTASTPGILNMVAAGLGVTILADWIWHERRPDIALRELPEIPQVLELAMVWNKGNPSQAVQDFVAIARETILSRKTRNLPRTAAKPRRRKTIPQRNLVDIRQ